MSPACVLVDSRILNRDGCSMFAKISLILFFQLTCLHFFWPIWFYLVILYVTALLIFFSKCTHAIFFWRHFPCCLVYLCLNRLLNWQNMQWKYRFAKNKQLFEFLDWSATVIKKKLVDCQSQSIHCHDVK